MKKSSRRWKVFVIVLCMLFTMTPITAFADEPADPPIVVDQPSGDNPTGPGIIQGDKPDNPDTVSPPAIPEIASSPAITKTASPPAITDPVSPPAIIDTVSPPAVQMMLTVPMCTDNGTIEIEKIIENDPGTNEIFTFEIYKWTEKYCYGYSYWDWEHDQTVTRAGVGIVTVDGLSYGDYKVKEVNIPDYYVAEDDETGRFTIGSDDPVPVTFTNTHITGIITIEKTLAFNVPDLLQDTFTFEIYKKTEEREASNWELVDTVSRKGAGIVTCGGLLLGEYKVKEVDLPTHYTVAFNLFEKETEVKKPNYTAKVVKFTNQYNAGTITINKEVIGDSESDATFIFDIYKKIKQDGIWTWVHDRTVSREGEGAIIAAGLANGDYKITERDVKYYDTDQSVELRTIWDWDRHKNVSFTNTYIAPTTGGITITKEIQGDLPPEQGDRFTFTVTDTSGVSTSVYITGEESDTISNLTPGTYTITEAAIANYTPRAIEPIEVTAGDPTRVTVINDYNDPNMDDPAAFVTKSVAEFGGVSLPVSFGPTLNLSALNKEVIFKIDLTCNSEWSSDEKLAYLRDSYGGNDITDALLIFNGEGFENAKTDDSEYPSIYLHHNSTTTYYYKTTLTTNGNYINTAYLYGSAKESQEIASSTAVVVVNYTPPDNNGDDDDDDDNTPHHHYYQVTYNSNYPAGTDTSGTVPFDSKNYSSNNVVNVKGNTGELKAGTYTFIGWNTKADGTGTMYLPGNTFNIKEDTILYAQWKLTSETAVTDPNSGTDDGGAVTAETVQANGLDDVPKTGTGAPLILMFLLGLISLAGITLGRKKILD